MYVDKDNLLLQSDCLLYAQRVQTAEHTKQIPTVQACHGRFWQNTSIMNSFAAKQKYKC